MRCRLQLCDQKWMFGGGMQNFLDKRYLIYLWLAVVEWHWYSPPKSAKTIQNVSPLFTKSGQSNHQKGNHRRNTTVWPFSIGISMGFLSLVQVFSIHRLGKLTPAARSRESPLWPPGQVDFHYQFIIWYVSQPTKNQKTHSRFFDDIYDIYEPRTIYLVHHICNFVGCSYHVSESRSAFCNLNFVFSCIFGNQATPQYYSFT